MGGLPLNPDGIVVVRLTRKSRSPEVRQAILGSQFTAQAVRSVHDAGCELEPEWADGAMLLVPLTEELVCESGIQLTHTHVIAMAGDVENIRQAFKTIRQPPGKKWKER